MTINRENLSCLGPHGFHPLVYYRWVEAGAATERPILCVHGLTRNGRDFDFLAEKLAELGPVYAPDMPGRGASPWLSNTADYTYPVYVADIAQLIARTGATEVDFIGTSMGGIIGMMLASLPGSPIRRLVVNDVGGLVPAAGLKRIGAYVGRPPSFTDRDQLASYYRLMLASFGTINEVQLKHLVEHGTRVLPDGGYGLNYDPAIAQVFKDEPKDVPLWSFWDAITCPTLVIRGARSDLLTAEIAEEMAHRGPPTEFFVVEDAGHAPSLMAEAQIQAISRFLAS